MTWKGYFSSDYDRTSVEIGLYEILGYALAGKRYQRLIEEEETFLESLYDDIAPSITTADYEAGRSFVIAAKTEMTALLIIEEKEVYQAKKEKELRKAAMFQRAMLQLTEKEQEVLRIRYQAENINNGMSAKEFSKTLNLAEKKLILLLQEDRQEQVNAIARKKKAAAIQDQKFMALVKTSSRDRGGSSGILTFLTP